VFFFWFGLTVSPGGLAAVALPLLAAVLLSLTLNPLAGVITARIGRLGRVAATNIGTTVLARGEFSIILATLAATAGLDQRISPFVALYVLVLAISSPVLASRSRWLARLLPRRWFTAG
jgi:CPA2 family monovalent cation:H+ antiporter-2